METFKELIKRVGAKLKPKGFTKKGNSFYLNRSNNVGLIEFQKSRDSTKDAILFTVNIGVLSTQLEKILGKGNTVYPVTTDCHWWERVGFLMPEKTDFWWEIDSATSLDLIYLQIDEVIDKYLLPLLEGTLSDDQLILCWSSGKQNGINEFQRHLYYTTLLQVYGKKELPEALDDFILYSKSKGVEASARQYIKFVSDAKLAKTPAVDL